MIDAAARQAIVFTQDSDAPQSQRTLYIGTDNLAAGRQAGQLFAMRFPAGGDVMLFVGKLDAQNAQERVQGIRDALAESNIRILDVRTDDVDDVRAKANAADTLVRYPNVKALVGLWSYNGPAILNAVREAGKVGEREDHRLRRSGRDPGRDQCRSDRRRRSCSSRTSSAIRRFTRWRRRRAATIPSSRRRNRSSSRQWS